MIRVLNEKVSKVLPFIDFSQVLFVARRKLIVTFIKIKISSENFKLRCLYMPQCGIKISGFAITNSYQMTVARRRKMISHRYSKTRLPFAKSSINCCRVDCAVLPRSRKMFEIFEIEKVLYRCRPSIFHRHSQNLRSSVVGCGVLERCLRYLIYCISIS